MTPDFFGSFITKDNGTAGYERFFYTKRYVAWKSRTITGPDARQTIGRALGYDTDRPNFARRLDHQRRRYDAMDKRIPLAYLQTIGVKWDEFETCLEADRELFESESARPRYPRYTAVRYVAGYYGRVNVPENTREEDAIHSLNLGETARFSKMITYPELLMILIDAGHDGKPGYFWYPPEVRYGTKDVIFPALPRGMGVTRVT